MSKKVEKKNITPLHGMVQIIDRPKTADESSITYDANGLPTRVEIMKVGEWRYAFSEPVIIKADDLDLMVQNFKAGVRKGVAFDCDHDMAASTGWVQDLLTGTDANGIYTLYADVEWTPMGCELLTGKIYKFFSPEWYSTYEDPESGEVYEQVLTGGALTNRPLMKKLAPLVANEGLTGESDRFTIYREDVNIKSKRKASMLDLNVVRQNTSADACTPEEMALLQSHIGDLTSDELDRFGLEYPESDDENGDDTAGNDGNGTEDVGGAEMAKEKVNKKNMLKANEVIVSREELEAYKKMADEGHVAHEKLIAMEAEATVKSFIASEVNKDGKFVPGVAEELTSFYKGLSQKQADEFKSLVTKMPALNLFSEIGTSEDAISGAGDAIEAKAKEMMKANEKLSYSDAVRQVMASEPALAKAAKEEIENQ